VIQSKIAYKFNSPLLKRRSNPTQ